MERMALEFSYELIPEKRGSSQVCDFNPLPWLQHVTHSTHNLVAAGAIYMIHVISSTCLKMDFKFEKLKPRICIFFSLEDQHFILYLCLFPVHQVCLQILTPL